MVKILRMASEKVINRLWHKVEAVGGTVEEIFGEAHKHTLRPQEYSLKKSGKNDFKRTEEDTNGHRWTIRTLI